MPLDVKERAPVALLRPHIPASEPPAVRAGRAESRSIAAPLIAIGVAVLGFLPIAGWIPGGFGDAGFALRVSEWLSGSAIALGLGVVLALLARRGLRLPATIPGLWTRAVARFERAPLRTGGVVAGVALALYAVIARAVFDGRPLLIDEIAQALQARIFLDGRLAAPVVEPAQFFSTLHMVEHAGRIFSQFPPGGPAMLALGDAVGAMWLVGPVFGAIAVVLWALVLRRTEPRPGIALAALFLFAFAPFTAFMSGSHMNHVTVLAWTLAAVLGLVRLVQSTDRRLGSALLCGLGFGIAATIRPVDAFAFALPAGAWLLARALRDRERWPARVSELAVAAAGVAAPIALMAWFNLRTTGSPLMSGYELLWGAGHNIGFHRNPWGNLHTPANGLELVNLYFVRLQQYLFETPVPALAPAIGALALTRRLRPFDRYLLASSGLLLALYFAYWHDGFYLGPRFVYPLVPVAALWTARFLPLLHDWLERRMARPAARELAWRTAASAVAITVIIAITASVPLRVRQYRASFPVQRWDPDAALRAAGIDDAVILARESWEAQLVVRMRALGATQPEAERFYRSIDACRLDGALAALERDPSRARGSMSATLLPLMADSARVRTQQLSPGAFVRVVPGSPYSERCLARASETAAGTLPLAPLLLAQTPNVVFARELHELDTLLLARHPSRPVFLLRPAGPEPTAVPLFVPLSRDSLFRAARTPR
jgi:hypothetical protein